jgi:phosphoglycolate phosphatase-like HAD superfamily hydrolase
MRTLQTENLRKQTTNFTNFVTKALNAGQTEPAHVRARHEAEEADQTYRMAIRKLDRQRMRLEEGLEETLKTLQKWEIERLRAVKTGMYNA